MEKKQLINYNKLSSSNLKSNVKISKHFYKLFLEKILQTPDVVQTKWKGSSIKDLETGKIYLNPIHVDLWYQIAIVTI